MARKTRTHPMIPASPTLGADIADLRMAEEITIPVAHPDNAGRLERGEAEIHIAWTIGSQYSKAARKAQMAGAKLRLTADGKVEADAEDVVDSLLDQLVAVTRRWSLTSAGAPFPCTADNIRAILTDEHTAWTRPQVQTGYLSLSRFFSKANAA